MMRGRFELPVVLACLALACVGGAARAENIDPDNQGQKYAYGENVGWINFKPGQGPGVTVTASALTGYAWGENIGWINLSPVGGGVENDGQGKLSGFAWGENVGWINFSPMNGGVAITAQGFFVGHAWGENIGWITFNSSGGAPFGVRTGWRFLVAPALTGLGLLSAVALMLLITFAKWRRAVPPPAAA
jgi:hypothetical protein